MMNKIIATFLLFSISISFFSQNPKYDAIIKDQLLEYGEYLIIGDTFSNYKKIRVELLENVDLNTKNINLINSKVYSLKTIIKDEKGIEKFLKKSKKNPEKWKPSYGVYQFDNNGRKIKSFYLSGESIEKAREVMKNKIFDTIGSPILYTGNDRGSIDDVTLNLGNGKYYACRNLGSSGSFFSSVDTMIAKGKYKVVEGVFNYERFIYQGGLGDPDRMAYKCKIYEKNKAFPGYAFFFKNSKMSLIVKEKDLSDEEKRKNYAIISKNKLKIKREQQSIKLNKLFGEWEKIFPDSSFFVFYEPWKMTGFRNFSNNLTYGELIISNNSKLVDSIYSLNDTIFKSDNFSLKAQKPVLIGKYNILDILTKPINIGGMYYFSGSDIYNSSTNDTLKKVAKNTYKFLTRKYLYNYNKTSELSSKDYSTITDLGKFIKWGIYLEADINSRKLSKTSNEIKSYGQEGTISIKISGGNTDDLNFNSEIKISGYNNENEFYFQSEKKDKRFDMSSLDFYFAQKFEKKDEKFFGSNPSIYNTENLLMSIEESKEFYALWQHNDFLGELKQKVREKGDKEEEEKAKRLLIKKYGSKYANAYFDYRIIVGMPEELAKNLLRSLYSITSNSQSKYGDSYYGKSMFNSAQKIHVSFRNKKVSYVYNY